MGYQANDLYNGYNFLAPNFTSVGKTASDVQTIQLSGEGVSSWQDSIQFLDGDGQTKEDGMFMWTSAEDSPTEVAGWLNGDGDDLLKMDLPEGQSFLIMTYNEGVKATVSGQVATDAVGDTYSCYNGYNFFGNRTAVKQHVQKFALTGEGISSWQDSIQFLDGDGQTKEGGMFMWTSAEDSPIEVAGWLNGDGDDLLDLDIDPGVGFLIMTYNEGVSCYVPGMADKDEE